MFVSLNLDAHGRGAVTIDGTDYSHSLRRVRVDAGVNEVTTLTLDAIVREDTRIDLDSPRVLVPQATHDLLVAIGWQPPTP